jgi:hypothetical protein
VWKQHTLPKPTASKIDSTNSDQPAEIPVAVDIAKKRKAWEQEQFSKSSKRTAFSSPLKSFSPRRSESHVGVLRFTRNGVRARSAMTVLVDDSAAHNIIDRSLVSNASSTAAISIFGRKTVADVPMILLEFSLDCNDEIENKFKLREWFRVSDVGSNPKVVVRGIFEALRINNTANSAAVSEYSQREKRLGQPSREQIAAVAALATGSKDDEAVAAQVFKENGGSYVSRWAPDSRFVSLHPVTHRKLQRDVNRPVFPFPGDNKHASAKINMWDSARRDLLKRAVKQAVLHD